MSYKIKNKDLVFIFDSDGVILETPQSKSWERTVADFGWKYSGNFDNFYQENLASIDRKTCCKKLIEMFNPEKKDNEELITRIYNQKQKRYEELILLQSFRVYSDIKNIIIQSRKNGIPIGVCSASENTENLLLQICPNGTNEKLFEYFIEVTAGLKKYNARDKSELYKLSFERMQKKRSFENPCIIVFEDSGKGIQAAKSQGYKTIGIGRNNKSIEELKKSETDILYSENRLEKLNLEVILRDISKIVD